MAHFLTYHLKNNQPDLIDAAFELHINRRGESFRNKVLSYVGEPSVKALFDKVIK